jgi:hypothetical protein
MRLGSKSVISALKRKGGRGELGACLGRWGDQNVNWPLSSGLAQHSNEMCLLGQRTLLEPAPGVAKVAQCHIGGRSLSWSNLIGLIV